MTDCAIVFEHEITCETLKLAKTNNLSELTSMTATTAMSSSLSGNAQRVSDLSKIISVQSVNGRGILLNVLKKQNIM